LPLQTVSIVLGWLVVIDDLLHFQQYVELIVLGWLAAGDEIVHVL